MGFIEKAKEFISGKTELEIKQEKAADKLIRKEALAAALRERRKQQIKISEEKEKAIAEKRIREIKRLNNPVRVSSVNYWNNMSYGSPFGQQRFNKSINTQYKKIKSRRKSNNKKIKSRRKSNNKNINSRMNINKFDILGI